MKKLLLSGSVAALLLPTLAFAAYGDVSLTTSTVFSINGITLNVSGSTATVESVVAGATTLVVTIEPGSSFQVTAPNLNKLLADAGAGRNVDTCTGSASVLGYNLAGSAEVVATITPSTTLCADPAGSSGSGGSGGGGSTFRVTPVAPVTPVVQVANNAEAIAAIKTQLVSLIQELIALLSQELIVLLNQEIQTTQASGTY